MLLPLGLIGCRAKLLPHTGKAVQETTVLLWWERTTADVVASVLATGLPPLMTTLKAAGNKEALLPMERELPAAHSESLAIPPPTTAITGKAHEKEADSAMK